jgi:hypothetical protein
VCGDTWQSSYRYRGVSILSTPFFK